MFFYRQTGALLAFIGGNLFHGLNMFLSFFHHKWKKRRKSTKRAQFAQHSTSAWVSTNAARPLLNAIFFHFFFFFLFVKEKDGKTCLNVEKDHFNQHAKHPFTGRNTKQQLHLSSKVKILKLKPVDTSRQPLNNRLKSTIKILNNYTAGI